MTLNQIISKAVAAIDANGGLVNYDYWRGYCDAFDAMKSNEKGSTWKLLKPQINHACDQYKTKNGLTD